MSKIERFEDIESWQLARALTAGIYRATNVAEFSRDFGLKDQIRRAAVSIMTNIAEGFRRGGYAELLQFLAIASGSAAEVQAQLYVALDAGYVTEAQFQKHYQLTDECAKKIGGFIRYLKQSDLKGPKYK